MNTLLDPILLNLVGKEDRVLELGCGNGRITNYLPCKELVGIDAFDYSAYFKGKFILHNINDLSFIEDNSFDVVLAIDVIEHLEKEDGFKLLKEMDRIAKRTIFVFTPKKWTDNRDSVENKRYWSYGNMYNYHKSLWVTEDFVSSGYEITLDANYVFATKRLQEI